MRSLRDQKAFTAAPELFKQLTDSWEKQLDELKKQHIATCTSCQEATAGLPINALKEAVPDCYLYSK